MTPPQLPTRARYCTICGSSYAASECVPGQCSQLAGEGPPDTPPADTQPSADTPISASELAAAFGGAIEDGVSILNATRAAAKTFAALHKRLTGKTGERGGPLPR